MCGCRIFIHNGTYQESLNNWIKILLWFLKNRVNFFISESDEQLNAENIASIYSEVVLSGG